jgi:ubiquinol-cytochrome c reductase iron-sulfur subunit
MSDDRHHPRVAEGTAKHEDTSLLVPAEPIADPGIEEHLPRPQDVDAKLEKRAERQVAGMFGAASLLMIAFCVFYFVYSPTPGNDKSKTILGMGASNVTLGMTLGVAFLLIGAGAIQWAKKLMSDEEIVEYRHHAGSSDEDNKEAVEAFFTGVEESGFGRRPLIRNSLFGALGLLGLPTIILLRDLGPLPGNKYSTTVWEKGIRIVNDVTGTPIKATEVEINQLINAEPALFFDETQYGGQPAKYEGTELVVEKTKAAVIVVRMPPEDIRPIESRKDWGYQGILCYSKICTHVGCPISLWEAQTHQLLCPCHQSTFDLADNAKVVFGPAARPLPQLPIMIDDEGYLVAAAGFQEPVGPSFWERG